jgi:molecular chaperone HtpG
VDSPAAALNADAAFTANLRRILRAMKTDGPEPAAPVVLQLNPRHPLVKNLATLRERDPALAKLVAEQIYDNALLAGGLLEDPRRLVQRAYELLERVAQA